MPEFVSALVAVLLMAATQLLFKSAARRGAGAGATLFSRRVACGLGINAAAAACWVFALRRLELSYAFPLLCLNFALVPIAARWLFGERLRPGRVAAIGVIVIGVALCASSG